MMTFVLFISFIILLRIGELILSRSNEIWLLQNGAVEYGQKHYPYIVALHVLFIVSLIIEYSTKQTAFFSLFFLVLYLLFLAFKVWVILSLGKFWNTKIYHISDFPLIKNGVYKYVKHPNYLVVIAEIAIIPLVFHLYYTAIAFTILNAIMLSVRVKEENKVLKI
ncbi:isoprenylcysteine carboxyl methyltransferase family protein [Flavobacterium sp. UBA6031]|uniref:isoprenylcysteine carboxyl methyltransferase family protein n=1 Tax=Flavobacterium sp. UBA6031 TaxID=1946551 RepID=UPI0025C2870B|nr:isoprenylcysteine carboxylmethyltransferase family protein [Flavobacterium sp. UBA6031]